MYCVAIYIRVRRACLKDGMSGREASRYFNKDRKTIAKMLRHELPPDINIHNHRFACRLRLMLGSSMRSCAPIRL